MLSNQNTNWIDRRDFNSIAQKAIILVMGPLKSWRLAAAVYKSASHDIRNRDFFYLRFYILQSNCFRAYRNYIFFLFFSICRQSVCQYSEIQIQRTVQSEIKQFSFKYNIFQIFPNQFYCLFSVYSDSRLL